MRDSSKGLGCLVLFALPFAGVGLFMAYLTGAALWEWQAMRAWTEVPATVESAALETHRGSDSTTYEVVASYRYQLEGVEYRGERVSLHRGGDNIGDFHHRVHRELSRAMRSKTPVSCYVNPEMPHEAILYREPRWGRVGLYAILFVVFGGVGFGLLFGGWVGSRKLARHEDLALQHPDEPWLSRDEWRAGRIPSMGKPATAMSVFFAVVWNTVSAPLLFIVPEAWSRGNVAALIGLAFPLAGVGLLFWAGRNLVRVWKFGESFVELSTIPGVIGGRLAGRVRMSKRIENAERFQVRLSAVRRVRVRTGRDSRMEETVLWEKSQSVSAVSLPGLERSGVPFSIAIPGDLPSTDESDPSDQTVWRLDVTAEVPGVDYEAQFEVPVFRTPESGKHPESAEPESKDDIEALNRRLEKAKIRVELLASGKRYRFPLLRQMGAVLVTTVLFLGWSGIVVALFYSDAPRFFGWVFGAFDLLLFFSVLDVWLYASHLEVRPGELAFQGGLFGGTKRTRWSAAEVQSLDTRKGMQAVGQQYHQLVVVTRGRRKHVVAKRIPDLELARHLAQDVEAVLHARA